MSIDNSLQCVADHLRQSSYRLCFKDLDRTTVGQIWERKYRLYKVLSFRTGKPIPENVLLMSKHLRNSLYGELLCERR